MLCVSMNLWRQITLSFNIRRVFLYTIYLLLKVYLHLSLPFAILSIGKPLSFSRNHISEIYVFVTLHVLVPSSDKSVLIPCLQLHPFLLPDSAPALIPHENLPFQTLAPTEVEFNGSFLIPFLNSKPSRLYYFINNCLLFIHPAH